jgi:hypothetical protein
MSLLLQRATYHGPKTPSGGINQISKECGTITRTRGHDYHTHEVARLFSILLVLSISPCTALTYSRNNHNLPSLPSKSIRDPRISKCSHQSQSLTSCRKQVNLIHAKSVQRFQPHGEVVQRLGDDAMESTRSISHLEPVTAGAITYINISEMI